MDYGHGPADISIEGDVERGHAFIPRARHMLARLLARMQVGGLFQGTDHWVLDPDDGSYCYAIVAGSVRKVVIVVGGVNAEPNLGVRGVYAQIPDFVSGVVVNGTIPPVPPPQPPAPAQPERLKSFWPTPKSAALHGLPAGRHNNARLAVEPYTVFDELRNNTGFGDKYSQYTKLKPTMYSGLMRSVVQLVMGFGKQLSRSIYDETPPRIPQPGGRRDDAPPPTKYERDVLTNGRQVRFDWRWYRTHGITKALDGTLWIVEVGSARGVLAYRLPMNAFTKDPRFVEKLDELGDDAGRYALEQLGAFPTGESIPTVATDSWKRAGLVIDLASTEDMRPFYENTAFASPMGWAFSPDGREAHNTCNGWDGDMQNSSHYALRINIGNYVEVEPPAGANRLKAKFASLSGKDGFRDRFPAVMAKIDRLESREVTSYLQRNDPVDLLFNDLDSVQLTPCATGSASLSRVSKSPLYHPGKYQRLIKFPHPELGYLVSHDMRSSGPVDDVRCDAAMHVFYAQGQLKIVRYFRDMRPRPETFYEDDFEECMLVGTWRSHQETAPRAIQPQMYSTDFDDRQELSGSTRDTVIKSVDLGYCRVGIQDDITYLVRSWVFRERRFMRTFETKIKNGNSQGTAVTVPFHDRCAYYFTNVVGSESSQEFGGASFTYLTDPWFCETWRNFGGWTSGFAEHPDECCICQVRTVRSPAPRYAPNGYNNGAGACADFSDDGPWCFLCDNAEALVYAIPPPPLPTFPAITRPPEYHRVTHLVNDTDFSPLLIEDKVFDALRWERFWFIPSPDPDGGSTQYLDATHNAFGTAQALKFWMAPNEGPIETRGAPFPPGYDGENITFIGVVP